MLSEKSLTGILMYIFLGAYFIYTAIKRFFKGLFYLMEMFRTPSLRDSISVTLRKLLEGGSSGEVRLYTSLQQREQAV